MTLIHVDGGTVESPRANEHLEGDYYDRCPVHGGDVVEAQHKSGGIDTKGEEYRDWAIYNSDSKQGGCGDTWSRTTAQGRERDNALGREPMQLTRGATRTVFAPGSSQSYRENYERIFGHA